MFWKAKGGERKLEDWRGFSEVDEISTEENKGGGEDWGKREALKWMIKDTLLGGN